MLHESLDDFRFKAPIKQGDVHLIDQVFQLSASPDEAHNNWDSLVNSGLRLDGDIPVSFLRIFGNSRFLSRFAIQNSSLLSHLLNNPYLHANKPFEAFKSEVTDLCKTSPALLFDLKKYKYLELLRISMKDLEGTHDLSVLRELSYLAHTLLVAITNHEFDSLSKKYGSPLLNNGQPCKYHYLALGKLGGFELNYSSDIDMMAITESDEGASGQLSLHEFFVKLSQNITHTMQLTDELGFFYRVDWDLRPEGKAGTLVNSISALETYYETFGAEWERQVFTKASLGSGDSHLGESFIKSIQPFCYRKNFDLESVRRIQIMKDKIHDSIQSSLTKGFNVKLGVGGIRDIEFFAQAFLMVFGGTQPAIRHVSTIEVIQRLRRARFISDVTESELLDCYYFLRRLENKLQMVDETQTHILSLDDVDCLKFSRRMGFAGSDDQSLSNFRNRLDSVRAKVSEIFQGLFSEKKTIVSAPPFSLVASDVFAEKIRPKLLDNLNKATDFERKLDVFRLFKKEIYAEIHNEDQPALKSRRDILKHLSLTAEMIVQEALSLAIQELTPKYGLPMIEHSPEDNSHFVVLGMGKLGGYEINYHSDLDVIFIYSHNGETSGPKQITNSEYYSRLVQKLISILSVPTGTGIAYEVDTELRPSGHKGTLVTSLESFLDYQTNVSSIWERQALIRANPIAGSGHLAKIINEHITALLYSYPIPKKIKKDMHKLRTRVIKELAHESKYYFDYKLGMGGLMDIEYILQYFQLTEGSANPSLRVRNTFEGLERLLSSLSREVQIKLDGIDEAYEFWRFLESEITLISKRRIHGLKYDDTILDKVAMNWQMSKDTLISKIKYYKNSVRNSYRFVFGLKQKVNNGTTS